MTYLIIEKDYSVSQSQNLTAKMRMRARTGDASIIDCSTMMGLNRPTYEFSDIGEWSYINQYEEPE
jgi:hypothetical protein